MTSASTETKASADAPPHQRWLTVLLSLLYPGLGHLYVGKVRRGAIWFLIPHTALLLLARPAALAGWAPLFGLLFFGLAGARLGAALDALRTPPAHPPRLGCAALVACVIGFTVFSRLGGVALRFWGLEAFAIPSGAMTPSLIVGDRIFADKAAYDDASPERGDVALFQFPQDRDKIFIFRVIGLPGDVIEEREGQLTINGWKVPRCELGEVPHADAGRSTAAVEFLGPRSYLVMHDASPTSGGPWRVRPGEYFVIGDNRSHSYDARAWGGDGAVPRDHFVGRALHLWWSTTPGGAVRMDRVGMDVATTALPPDMLQLGPALERCLASRPSPEAATPPPP